MKAHETKTQDRETARLLDCIGRSVVDDDGERIGELTDVYVDQSTRQPEWLAVKTGWFGMKTSFVPLTDMSAYGDEVRVPWSKDRVKDAPKIDPDGSLSEDQEGELYRHYGISYSDDRSSSQLPDDGAARTNRDITRDTTMARGTTNRDAGNGRGDDAMTRSEQELDVDKRTRETGRARLKKWVETEHVNVTVPVRKENGRLDVEGDVDSRGRTGKRTGR